MTPIITYALAAFLAFYCIIILIELALYRKIKRFALEVLIPVGALALLYLTTGFPFPATKQAFGGESPLAIIGLMFVCVLVGIAARYIFYLKGTLSWLSLLKPLCISPLVLLPLIGSVQGIATFEPIQMISFGILAFQNGFFWEIVLERAKPQT